MFLYDGNASHLKGMCGMYNVVQPLSALKSLLGQKQNRSYLMILCGLEGSMKCLDSSDFSERTIFISEIGIQRNNVFHYLLVFKLITARSWAYK